MRLCLALFVSMIGYASTSAIIIESPGPRVKEYEIVINSKADWWKAGEYCHSNGMKLLSILSKDENDFISIKLKEHGLENTRFWTSGTCEGEANREFYWKDIGKKFAYTNWIDDEPNNWRSPQVAEDCVELRYNSQKWNDSICAMEKNFICEKHHEKQDLNIDHRNA